MRTLSPIGSARPLLLTLLAVAVSVMALDGAIALLLASPPRAGPLLAVAREFYANVDRDIIQFNPAAARWDPELFYTLRPGRFVFVQREFRHEFRVNRLGLRDSEAALVRPTIIAVGDSFTMGWGVAQEEAYPKVLEAATGLRTLNAGIASYGTVREMLLLNRLDTSALRFLIVQYHVDDVGENLAFQRQGNRHISRNEARWNKTVADLARKRRYFPGKYAWEAIRRVVRGLTHRPRPAGAAAEPDEADAFLNALGHAPRVDLRGVHILVWAPTTSGFLDAVRTKLERGPYPSWVRHLVLVDVASALRPARDGWHLDEHLNASGHRVAAERLAAAIRQLSRAPDDGRRHHAGTGAARYPTPASRPSSANERTTTSASADPAPSGA
jgi:lysophospholipase L1-like esterase